jgi:ABC-2 type transport system ATP-binding protein
MLEAIELTKRYEDGHLALDRLDLRVGPGEIYCLLGANGAGKTTTINLFLGFIRPDAGRALICGVEVDKDPLEAKKHVAYVSENVMLYGSFTARQNLDFFTRLGGREGLTKEAYHDVLRRVGLPEKAFEQPVKQFSKGMRQKVGIAIAVTKNASVLLLDEPMSGLDPAAAAELVRILLDLGAQGKSILMSTHDVFRAKEMANRVGIMKNGHKVAEMTAQEVAKLDLEKVYLEYMSAEHEPPVRLVAGQR